MWVLAGVLLLCLGVSVVSAVSPINWATITVDDEADVGAYTSLALDRNGNPNISYFDATNGDLKYASFMGGSWTNQTVDSADVCGGSTSLGIDRIGYPHISYCRGAGTILQYAAYGPPWTIYDVDTDLTGTGEYSSLTFTPAGSVIISNYGGNKLETVTGLGTVWSSPVTVEDTGDVGMYSSINYTFAAPAISYYNVSRGDLNYAEYVSGPDPGYAKETVDFAGNVGLYTSLEFDSFGNPHISYYDATNGDLKYATKSGGSWTIESVDTAGDVGRYTSLDLDSAGNTHISYYDTTNGDLKFAMKSGGSWEFSPVDTAGNVGMHTSLALDSAGLPLISYYDVTNSALKFVSGFPAATSPCGQVVLDVAPLDLNANGRRDLDRGDPGLPTGASDILWNSAGSQMEAENGATLAYLGPVDFGAVTFSEMVSLPYSTTPISGGDISPGNVFAAHTNLGNYTKIQVISRDGASNLQIHLVMYGTPEPCQEDGYDYLIDSPDFGGSLPDESAMYASNEPLPANTPVDQWGGEIERRYTSPGEETWLYVYDPTPRANWEHQVSYYFVNLEDGSIDGPHTAFTPPLDIPVRWIDGAAPLATIAGRNSPLRAAPGMNALSIGGTFLTGATLTSVTATSSTPDCTQVTCEHCYALLISGGVDRDHNYDWYYEDISSMYRVLTDTYCYPAANIYVLMSDGTSTDQDQTLSVNPLSYTNSIPNLDGEGGDDVNGVASLQEVVNTLDNLMNNVLGSEDTLFIFTTNHGGVNPTNQEIRLWLWGRDYIGVQDFISHLGSPTPAKTPRAIYLLMEQCNSGGFVNGFISATPANQARVIATATTADRPSYENDFSSWWIKGVAAPGPANFVANGGDGNNLVSMSEAFYYAKAWDPSRLAGLETPQYSGGSLDAGQTLGLSSCSRCAAAGVLENGIMPKDRNGDGLYEDVNGDDSFTKEDAVAYFTNMAWIANPAHEPACAFDFNGNSRIDFMDIVKLYGMAPS